MRWLVRFVAVIVVGGGVAVNVAPMPLAQFRALGHLPRYVRCAATRGSSRDLQGRESVLPICYAICGLGPYQVPGGSDRQKLCGNGVRQLRCARRPTPVLSS